MLPKRHAKPLVYAILITIVLLFVVSVLLVVSKANKRKDAFDSVIAQQSLAYAVLAIQTNLYHRNNLLNEVQRTDSLQEHIKVYRRYKAMEWFDITALMPAIKVVAPASHALLQDETWHFNQAINALYEKVDALIKEGGPADAMAVFSTETQAIQSAFLNGVEYALYWVDTGYAPHKKHSYIDTVNTLNQLTAKNSEFPIIALLGGIGIILSLFSFLLVTRGTTPVVAVNVNDERLLALQQIIFQSNQSAELKTEALLKLTCRLLGMDIAIVERLDMGKKTTTILHIITPYDFPVKQGIVFPTEKTLCHASLSSAVPMAISDISKSEYKNHPLVTLLGIQSYIGTAIRVNQQVFGVVSFSTRKPANINFNDNDFVLLNFVADWVGFTMENQLKAQSQEAAVANAEAANRAKSAFLASMSHEIRTPLTAILGFSDMLRDTDQSKEDVEHEVGAIIRSGVHLQRIVNDILDLSKIEAGQLTVECIEMDITMLILDMDSIFAGRARKQGITFDIEYDFPIPATIVTDPTRLKQVLFNLCGNAIKFTESGGVKVKIGLAKNKRQLLFSISDTGIGMDEKEISRLFKPFSQANTSTTRKFGGTGLGLCISRQLAQNLGGDVVVSSEKGKGSTFVVSTAVGNLSSTQWFYCRQEVYGDEPIDIVNKSLSVLSGQVLLVETNPNIKTLISNCLRDAGVDVDVVGDGLSAVQQAMTHDYDLILTATKLPVMNGLHLTRKLRSQGYKKPIVGMPETDEPSALEKYLNVGANDCISQPVDIQQFYTILAKYLRSEGKPDLGLVV